MITIYEYVNYTLDNNENTEMIYTDFQKDFDINLKFNVHINTICKKAYMMLGFVLRNCKLFANGYVLFRFRSLVSNILDYCTPVWRKSCNVYKHRLDRIQIRFFRFLQHKYHDNDFNNTISLARFNINSLEQERDGHDFIL